MSSEIQRQLAKIFKVSDTPQLAKALFRQFEKSPFALANALLHLKICNERDLCKILSQSYSNTWINFSNSIFDLRALGYVPIKQAKKHKAFPVAMNDDFVVLWSSKQSSPELQTILEEKTERRVLIYMALQNSLLASIEDIYLSFHRRDMTYCGSQAKGIEPGLDLHQPSKSTHKKHFLKFLSDIVSIDLMKFSLEQNQQDDQQKKPAPKVPTNGNILSHEAPLINSSLAKEYAASPSHRVSAELMNIVGDVALPVIQGVKNDLISMEEERQTLSQDLAPKKIESSQNSAHSSLSKADFFFVQKDYGSAREHCLKHFRRNPLDAAAQVLLGKIAMEQGEWLIARDYHEQSVDLNPHIFEAQANLALIYERLNEKALALSTWVKAIKLSPEDETSLKLKEHVKNKYPHVQGLS